MKTKKNKKNISAILARAKKRFFIFLFVIIGLFVLWLVLGIFLFFNQGESEMYVFPENFKQGDTVFIKVKSEADNVVGNFAGEKLVFYRKGKLPEWISFLGIDAEHKPGDYKIFIDTDKAEHLIKEIRVGPADFSSAATISAPDIKKDGLTKDKAADNIVKNDNPALKKVLSNFTSEPYFNRRFSFPLRKMEKVGFSFGKFIGFAKSKLQHLGVDLRAPEKTDIYSVNDGKVVATLNLSNYGKTVIIDHGLDIFSLYLHLDEFEVSEGQMVRRGQVIGLSGDTGYSTAPHLHFSIRVGSSRVDPIVFIETTKKMDENSFIASIINAFYNIILPPHHNES